MNDAKSQQNWNERQIKYIHYVGRGKRDKYGKRVSMEDFASAIGVNRSTLYDWQHLPGFASAVFEFSMAELAPHLPDLNAAIIGKAGGVKEFKNADTQAYVALMRQYELLKSDKIDHTTNGKDIPAPILGGTTNG